MKHITLILFFIDFTIGFIALAFIWIAAWKQKKTYLRFLFIFNILFTTILIADNTMLYIGVNMPYIGLLSAVYFIKNFLISLIALIILFMMPLFFHNLLEIPELFIKNLIISIIALATIAALLFPYILLFIYPGETNRLSGAPIVLLDFIIFISYFIYLILKESKKVYDRKSMPLVFISLIAYIIFGLVTSGMVGKFILSGIILSDMAYYFIWSLYIIFYSFKFMKSHSFELTFIFLEKYKITGREKEIIIALAEGKNNRQIGNELFISFKTVKNHIYNVYKKLGVKNRVELVNLIHKK